MKNPVLTIAVPTYNMERWLEKNLDTYADSRLYGHLEVLCLNNASEDSSKEIINRFTERYPEIFTLVDRPSRGYGGSINEAIMRARGKYFRIVDADDWVNTEELVRLVDALETCQEDVVLTDYQIISMLDNSSLPVRAGEKGALYGSRYDSFEIAGRILPSIHSTTYRTEVLRKHRIELQDNIFFVDEEYVILPYLFAESMICFPYDVYRYQVSNPEQSTSPKNRAKYQQHREQVLKRLIAVFEEETKKEHRKDALEYCFTRISNGVGDHYTTLYLYETDKKRGRRQAEEWSRYLKKHGPEFYRHAFRKKECLLLLNIFHISLKDYNKMKHVLLNR